jgi:hypothetical protein
MQRNIVWTVLVLTLAAGIAPAAAQPASDDWDVAIAPYLMGAAMSGTTTVRGLEADVDVSASGIFSNLQFGAMGMFAARKGNWGVGGDVIWMALGTTVREISVDFNQGGFVFYGLRRLGAAADLTFGLRVNTLQGELDFKRLGVAVDQSKTWVDPLVGVLLRTTETHRLGFRLYSEIGGFALGSDFAWQVFPVVRWSRPGEGRQRRASRGREGSGAEHHGERHPDHVPGGRDLRHRE